MYGVEHMFDLYVLEISDRYGLEPPSFKLQGNSNWLDETLGSEKYLQ